MPPRFIDHLNNNLFCVLDSETTGVDHNEDLMWQLCILPLNSQLEPAIKEFGLFNITMKVNTDNIDFDISVFKKNKDSIMRAQQVGFSQDEGVMQFMEWFDRLGLIGGKKIMPLGHSVDFDLRFIEEWLTHDVYKTYFDYHRHDTFATASFLNMQASFRAEPVPFPKWQLTSLAKRLGISTEGAHDALVDCQTTAKVYRKLMNHSQGLVFQDHALKKLALLREGRGCPQDLTPETLEWIQSLVDPALKHVDDD